MTTGDDSRRRPRIFSRTLLAAASVGLLGLAVVTTAATATSTHAARRGHRVHRSRASTQTVLSSFKSKQAHGTVLALVQKGQKLALFSFSNDTIGTSKTPPKSACNGTCAKTWYPLIKHGTISIGSGINKKAIKTFKRSDGSIQVAYYGQPLYRCRKNTKTGMIDGANQYQFGGSWGLMSSGGSNLTLGGPQYGGGKTPPGC